jgi:hypothetical protein
MILTIAIIDDGLIHKMNKFTWLLEDKELAWKISLSLSIYIFEYSSWEKKAKKNLNYRRWTSNHVFGMQLLYKLFWPHGEGHEQTCVDAS